MKKLLASLTLLFVAFGLSISQTGFGQTNPNINKTQGKIQVKGAKLKLSPKLGIRLDNKAVKELTLKDGTKLDAITIKKEIGIFKIEKNLLKYKDQVVQSFILGNGGSTRFVEECSCYPPPPPPPGPGPFGSRGGIRPPPSLKQ